jgi:predicted nucleic acid-binding protein
VREGLLDTTFFIDLLRGDTGAAAIWREVVAGDFRAYYSPITVTELWMSQFSTFGEEQALRGALQLMEEIPLSASIAELAGLSLRDLPVARGRQLTSDALIASTALHERLTLYTRNQRDMQHFAGGMVRY